MGLLVAGASQAEAKPAAALYDPAGGGPLAAVPGVLQCVPFARDTSGIRLYGDAHTWWNQAEGRYARGRAPRPGSVMAIQPHGGSTLGHVATVRRVVDARTILIDHANWSAPGKIERNVTAVDVSPANDWSEVRVWYAPIQSLGGAHWPVSGFIYNSKPRARTAAPEKLAKTSTFSKYVPGKTKVRFGFDPLFVAATSSRGLPAGGKVRSAPVRLAPVRLSSVGPVKFSGRKDPIGAIIASAR
ncbi:CHAP domain-containing protein [Novosphingobium sp. 9U]|uniref:CHAP domain-containing protein n=1 Tax=Novosphingobium sp. 9U TaxID=2653158 RepID=UPI00352DF529